MTNQIDDRVCTCLNVMLQLSIMNWSKSSRWKSGIEWISAWTRIWQHLNRLQGFFAQNWSKTTIFLRNPPNFFPIFFKNWPISTEILLKMHPSLQKWCSENRPSGWRIPVYLQRGSPHPPPPGVMQRCALQKDYFYYKCNLR